MHTHTHRDSAFLTVLASRGCLYPWAVLGEARLQRQRSLDKRAAVYQGYLCLLQPVSSGAVPLPSTVWHLGEEVTLNASSLCIAWGLLGWGVGICHQALSLGCCCLRLWGLPTLLDTLLLPQAYFCHSCSLPCPFPNPVTQLSPWFMEPPIS